MIDKPVPDTEHMARLHWQCRRGMRELDELLQGFLATAYADLSPAQRQAFEHLLASPDPLLLEYLMQRNVPIDKELASVIQQIRNSVGR